MGAWADHTAIEPKPVSAEDYIFSADGRVFGVGCRIGRQIHGSLERGWREAGGAWMSRVGKTAAGRLLDGREHNDMPEARG